MELPLHARAGSVIARHLDDHEPLVLIHLGHRRSLDRRRVEDWRGERHAAEVRGEHLVTMNVPRQHRGEPGWDVRPPDHVGGRRKGEVLGPDGRPFHALVHAEEPNGRAHGAPPRRLDEVNEPRAHVVALGREPSDRHADTADVHRERPRAVEHVDPWMLREAQLRNATPLVVARHDEDRNSTIGDARQRLESLPRHARRHTRAVEHVAAVHDEVDLPLERGPQRGRVVREEVVPPTPSLDARTRRQVEAEVGVREEEDADALVHTVSPLERRTSGSTRRVHVACTAGRTEVGPIGW